MNNPYEGFEMVMPSALNFEPEVSFRARVQRNKARPAEYGSTSVFRNLKSSQNVVMGQEALTSGTPVRITGAAKYAAGILDNLILGALQKVAPDGHDNVVVSCGHATDAVSLVDNIAKIIGGSHQVERFDGKKVNYRVRKFTSWDEPSGGIMRFAQRAYEDGLLEPYKKIGIVDIGGQISSMYSAETLPGGKIQIYWNQGGAFDIGIQNVSTVLADQLRSLYPETFTERTISNRTIEAALRTFRDGQYYTNHRGFEVEVTQAVLNATGTVLTQLWGLYTNNLSGGADLDFVVVTGGGGGLLFDMLCTEVINHAHVYRAEDETAMHLANLRGAEFSTISWAGESMPTLVKNGMRPLLLVIDPGNSYTKFKALWL